jgi:hypothetical protein
MITQVLDSVALEGSFEGLSVFAIQVQGENDVVYVLAPGLEEAATLTQIWVMQRPQGL